MDPQFTEQPGGVVGKPIVRVEGREKVTGKARYSAEFPLPGLTYGVLATSPIAKGRITRIDTGAAGRAPGVLAVLTHQNIPKLAVTPDTPEGKKKTSAPMGFMPLTSDEIFYAAQPVAVVVADTLERAQHAATLVQVSYQAAEPIAYFTDPKAKLFDPQKVQDGKTDGHTQRGDARRRRLTNQPFNLPPPTPTPVNHHNPMEPGSTTAVWEASDRLTVYESTQGVTRTQKTRDAAMTGPASQSRCASLPSTSAAALAARARAGRTPCSRCRRRRPWAGR